MTSVIAGSTRNPCHAGDTVVIGAWIAGQARNDSVGELYSYKQRTTKQSRVRLDCFLAIRTCRLGCLPLRPRRMYEEPQADRILRS